MTNNWKLSKFKSYLSHRCLQEVDTLKLLFQRAPKIPAAEVTDTPCLLRDPFEVFGVGFGPCPCRHDSPWGFPPRAL